MLRWVTRCAAVLGVVAVALSELWPAPGATLDVALGAALAVANLYALQWLGARLVSRGDAGGMASTAALFGVKLLAYLGLVFLVYKLFAVDLLALLAGLSVIVLAIPLGAVLGPPLNADSSESIHG